MSGGPVVGPLWRVGYHRAPVDFTPLDLYGFSHRFDDVERRFRTLYVGERDVTCLREVLADFRPNLAARQRHIERYGPQAVDDFPVAAVTAKWRRENVLVLVRLELDGPVVDLFDAGFRQELEDRHAPLLVAYGLEHLDLSEITTKRRKVTQTIAGDLYDRGAAAVPGLLLDVGTVNQIEGASDIALKPDPDNGRAFAGLNNDRPDCSGIQGPALQAALQSSGWIGVRTQMLEDPGAKAHMIINTVINYPTAKAAGDFAAHQAHAWALCSGATLHATAPDEPPSIWTVGIVSDRDGMLSVTNIEEGGQGWACQRALTVRNNIVVDVRSCGDNRTDQALTAATRIAERVSATS